MNQANIWLPARCVHQYDADDATDDEEIPEEVVEEFENAAKEQRVQSRYKDGKVKNKERDVGEQESVKEEEYLYRPQATTSRGTGRGYSSAGMQRMHQVVFVQNNGKPRGGMPTGPRRSFIRGRGRGGFRGVY